MLTRVQVDNTKKLISALRSGKYKQVRFKLSCLTELEDSEGLELDKVQYSNEIGYCCLGVACEESGLDAWNTVSNQDSRRVRTYLSMDGNLPTQVEAHYGFPTNRGFSILDIYQPYNNIGIGRCDFKGLDSLNDAKPNLSFAQIADVIQYWLDNQEVSVS